MDKAHLYYATDTYCVWCWGFGPALREFATRNANRLWVDVIPASMLVGERVRPVRDSQHAKQSAKRVAELCQVEFGDGFYAALDDGGMVLDSAVAARAYCAARELLGPEHGLEIAHALQYAWYWEGADLRSETVLDSVAQRLGIDAAKFRRVVKLPETEVARLAEVARRDILPVNGYPTLLLEMPDGTHQRIGAPTSSAERLQHVVDAYLTGATPDFDPAEEED